jgi:hypothetical protein
VNATEHRFFSAIALAAAGASLAERPEDKVPHAAAARVGGYWLGTLPDIVEPATSPHHRLRVSTDSSDIPLLKQIEIHPRSLRTEELLPKETPVALPMAFNGAQLS